MCGKDTQFGCGAGRERERERDWSGDRAERTEQGAHTHTSSLPPSPSLSISLSHSLTHSLSRTDWEKAAPFLRPDIHSHSFTGAHTLRATDICRYMQQICLQGQRRGLFLCAILSQKKKSLVRYLSIYLFFKSILRTSLRTVGSSRGFNMPDV